MFCPVCKLDYADDWKVCPKDATVLLRGRFVGKYRIDKLLGEGGMGAVYRALNPDTQSVVAVKLMHGGAEASDAARQRFQREASAVATLRTRHCVTIYDFGSDAHGTMYLVMEYLQGHPLRAEIAAQGAAIPLPRVNHVVEQALRGLGAAHRARIVHRDLKPENVFVADTDDGEVIKILDFGIARLERGDAANLTGSGMMMGTPAYMAPEQVAGNRGEVGPHSDVFAMGVIVYEMLAGRSPFAAETLSEVLSRILSRQFTPLAQLRPDLPTPLLEVIDRALAEDPARRYRGADELREAWMAAWAQLPAAIRNATVPQFAPGAAQVNARTGPAASSPTEPVAVTPAASPAARPAPAPTPAPDAGGDPGSQAAPEVQTSVTLGAGVVTGSGADPAPPRRSRGRVLAAVGAVGLAGVVAALALGGGGAPSGPVTGQSTTPPSPPRPRPDVDAGPPAATTPSRDAGGTVAPLDVAGALPGGAGAPGAPSGVPAGMVRLDGGLATLGTPPRRYRTVPHPDELRQVEVRPFLLDLTEVAGPDGMPLRDLTWRQAEAHCRAAGRRLPTAAEWEYAALRGDHAPAKAALKRRGTSGPSRVGAHPGDCTPDGVCDLLGNVMEWTADEFPGEPGARQVRGASYAVAPDAGWHASVHARLPLSPDRKDPEIGFRCAADAR